MNNQESSSQLPPRKFSELHQQAQIYDATTTLIRIDDVMAMVGLSRATIYKLMQRDDCRFPSPVKLSSSTARGAPVGWVLAEIQDWVHARIADRSKEAA
ncbi:helix-turn-helix transcriptional regulator [Pseudomonas syringae]|uniref:AlpA family transcriptional regulator n=1 Tax=Pseudomonas syringae TaxID=317 RepID=A0A085V6W2_PSESX|nr:AlpA family phage regulatory protein [Pseudomonas syringae]KFE51175.1 hypothetical protein IV02_13255 [Pseudomonas syringae]